MDKKASSWHLMNMTIMKTSPLIFGLRKVSIISYNAQINNSEKFKELFKKYHTFVEVNYVVCQLTLPMWEIIQSMTMSSIISGPWSANSDIQPSKRLKRLDLKNYFGKNVSTLILTLNPKFDSIERLATST